MEFEITDAHRWLEGFVGDWQMVPDPDGPPEQQVDDRIESGRLLDGGGWLVVEGRGTMGGGNATTIFTAGFDPDKGKYVGTWVGSMMNYMWIYEGERQGDRLILNCEGPNFEKPGQMQAYQDIHTFDGPNDRSLLSQTLQEDGTWKVFMTAKYKRK